MTRVVNFVDQFKLTKSNIIWYIFLNFIFNSFTTLQFTSKFNPIHDKLRLKQGPSIKKIKRKKKEEKDYPNRLTHYNLG
jgi:hypothetical protein